MIAQLYSPSSQYVFVQQDNTLLIIVNNVIVDPSIPVPTVPPFYKWIIFDRWFGIPFQDSIHTM